MCDQPGWSSAAAGCGVGKRRPNHWKGVSGDALEAQERRPAALLDHLDIHAGSSLGQSLHQVVRLVVAECQVLRVQASPAGLLLRQRQAFRVPHDLANTCVSKQVWMDWRRLTSSSVARGSQCQNLDFCPL